MTTSEARRHDLYAGLSRVLGQEQADTLMAFLPREEAVVLATRADVAGVEARLGARLDQLEHRMEQFEHRLDLVNQRLDRLFLTMGAGLLAVVATLVAGTFVG